MAASARFLRGDNVRVEVDVYDPTTLAETAVTPTTINVTIYDPNGNAVVTDAAMTAVSGATGQYYYERATTQTDLVGFWTVVVATTVTSRTGRIEGKYELFSAT